MLRNDQRLVDIAFRIIVIIIEGIVGIIYSFVYTFLETLLRASCTSQPRETGLLCQVLVLEGHIACSPQVLNIIRHLSSRSAGGLASLSVTTSHTMVAGHWGRGGGGGGIEEAPGTLSSLVSMEYSDPSAHITLARPHHPVKVIKTQTWL